MNEALQSIETSVYIAIVLFALGLPALLSCPCDKTKSDSSKTDGDSK